MTWLRVALLIGCAGCASEEPIGVELTIVTGVDDRPFNGADRIVFTLERDGESIQSQTFAADEIAGTFGPLGFGENLRIRVDAVASDFVLATGRSFPFAMDAGGPSRRPDVFVGRIGRFARLPLAPPDDSVVAVSATDDGALLATASGRIVSMVAHDGASAGAASLADVVTIPERAGATFCVIAGGLLLGVGGAEGGATLVDRSGRLASIESEAWDGPVRGSALASIDGTSVVVAGGLDASGVAVDRVLRIDVALDSTGTWSLAARSLLPLPSPRAGARAVVVSARSSSALVERVVVVGGARDGAAVDEALLIDPDGADTTVSLAVLGLGARGAAVAALGVGAVLVAGGTGIAGEALADVRVLSARAGQIDLVTPTPEPLFVPRIGAGAVALGEGTVLLAGGAGVDGAALDSAELFVFTPDTLPGVVRATGALPQAWLRPEGALLDDGSVLVADRGGLAIYVPARP